MSEQLTQEIINKFINRELGWLRLDVSFPEIEKELVKVEPYYVEHREGENHKGWESCCLHGLDVNKTKTAKEHGHEDELNAPYKWTKLKKLCPETVKFWDEFPAEKYFRIRFMKLRPRGSVSNHNDHPGTMIPKDLMNYLIPINVAIQHPSECVMHLQDHGTVPFKDGRVYLVNILKNHQISNNSMIDRIHMIAQIHVGNKRKEFTDLIARSWDKYGR